MNDADVQATPVTVLHVITGLALGGAETALLRLIAAADRSACRHAVLALGHDGVIADELRKMNVPVLVLRLDTWSGRLRFLRRAYEFVSRCGPDVIQGWMYHGNLAAYLLSRFVARSSRLSWNIRQSLYDVKSEKPGTRTIIRAGARVSSVPHHIIYNSNVSRVQHGRFGFCDERAMVIANGFDTSRYVPNEEQRSCVRQSFDVSSDELLIGTVSRYHPVKDHKTFVTACAMIVRAGFDARFAIVGPGCGTSNASLLRLVHATGLQDRVILRDQWDDTSTLYPAFDAFCLTSTSEGFPNVLGEAMSCGIPCVATDVGDCALLMGPWGAKVAPSSPDQVAQALLRLAGMAEHDRKTLGMKAREHICRNYALSTAVRRYEALYSRTADSADVAKPREH